MRPFPLLVLGTASRTRMLLVLVGTALVSGLLLVAVAVLRLGLSRTGQDDPNGFPGRRSHLFAPLADAGTRGGMVLGILLLTIPVLALLAQVIGFGTGNRERRNAALHVAGATHDDLRRWDGIEVGAPAALGALLGLLVWWALRQWLGHDLAPTQLGALVPADGPGWWTVPVVVAVAAVSVLAGGRVRSHPRSTTPGRGSGQPGRRVRFPLIWLLLLGLLVATLLLLVLRPGTSLSALVLLIPVAAVAVVIGLTPWLVKVAAAVLGVRTRSAARLLAARRLGHDAGAAARAAIATGSAGLAVGVCAVLIADDLHDPDQYDVADYTGPAYVVLVLAGLALGLVAISLAVHVADNLVGNRRAYAPLWAAGMPTSTVNRALRWETLAVTTPIATLGTALGGVAYGLLDRLPPGVWLPWAGVAVVTTLVATILIGVVATAALAPLVRATVDLRTLRTE